MAELVGWVDKSNADFVILGGDFNTDPKDKETSYHNLKTAMISSMEEFFLDIKVDKVTLLLYINLSKFERNGCAPRELHMATPRTRTAICTTQSFTTTYGTSLRGAI